MLVCFTFSWWWILQELHLVQINKIYHFYWLLLQRNRSYHLHLEKLPSRKNVRYIYLAKFLGNFFQKVSNIVQFFCQRSPQKETCFIDLQQIVPKCLKLGFFVKIVGTNSLLTIIIYFLLTQQKAEIQNSSDRFWKRAVIQFFLEFLKQLFCRYQEDCFYFLISGIHMLINLIMLMFPFVVSLFPTS